MSNLTATIQKRRKKQSPFDKLWQRANKIRENNERLKQNLDEIVSDIRQTLLPREIEISKASKPLVFKLLTLGQRKSMTNWEREMLDGWIQELAESLKANGLVDEELLDGFARYDAFRLGIQLEDDSLPPHQQLVGIIERAEQQEEAEAQQRAELKKTLLDNAQRDVEKALDDMFGASKDDERGHARDFFQDELNAETDKMREQLFESMLADRLQEIEDMFSEDDEFAHTPDLDELLDKFFDDYEDARTESESADTIPGNGKRDPAITNDVFQSLFRATAAKLHPDREPDETVRAEKQKLMARLLNARKSGDLMTVLELYESWVGTHAGFSKKDQKALQSTIEAWIEQLESDKDAIVDQSPLHRMAYEEFYSPSMSKARKAIAEFVKRMDEKEKAFEQLASSITSLKSLKPYLEQRYDMREFALMRALEERFQDRDW